MPTLSAAESVIAHFEGHWVDGERPDMAEVVARCPPDERASVLLELIHAELEFRLKAGEPATAAEYLTRFPELASDPLAVAGLASAEADLRRRLAQLATSSPFDTPPVEADVAPTTAAWASDPTALPSDFRFVRELGRGGMGVVVEAEDARFGRRVAVKQIRAEFATRPDAKARFLREARAMAAVGSDFIVPVLHVGEAADGTPYLVMPLLAGETLQARLERGRLTADELRRVALDTARGLAAAHAKGLVHRDIKPSNLWLEANSDGVFLRVRLLDFGLAKPTNPQQSAMTHSNAVVGTPWYMSPEQARADPLGPPSDLFSLGAVLYHAATGRPPFAGDTPSATFTALAVNEPTPVRELSSGLSDDLAELIHDALKKWAAERPATGDVICRLTATRPAAPHHLRERYSVRRRTITLAVFCAAVALAAAAIVIKIKTAGGEEVTLKVPSGTTVEVEPDGTGRVSPPRPIPHIGEPPVAPVPQKIPLLNDFRETHGADSASLEKWMSGLREEGFKPAFVSLTPGPQARFNSVAIPDPERRLYRIYPQVEVGGAMWTKGWQELRDGGFRHAVACLYVDDRERHHEWNAWVADGQPWGGWSGSRDVIVNRLKDLRVSKGRPVSFGVSVSRTQTRLQFLEGPDGGLDWDAFLELSAAELRSKVEDHAKKGWRLEWLAAYEGEKGKLQFLTLFVEDPKRRDWDFRMGMRASEYEAKLVENAKRGFRPVAVAGYPLDSETRYAAVWSGNE
jgi:serine/threonine protein kinase